MRLAVKARKFLKESGDIELDYKDREKADYYISVPFATKRAYGKNRPIVLPPIKKGIFTIIKEFILGEKITLFHKVYFKRSDENKKAWHKKIGIGIK